MKVKQHRAGAENLRIFSGHSGTLLELSYSSSMRRYVQSLKVSSCAASLLAAGRRSVVCVSVAAFLRGDLRRLI